MTADDFRASPHCLELRDVLALPVVQLALALTNQVERVVDTSVNADAIVSARALSRMAGFHGYYEKLMELATPIQVEPETPQHGTYEGEPEP